jgi:hypothetical protein
MGDEGLAAWRADVTAVEGGAASSDEELRRRLKVERREMATTAASRWSLLEYPIRVWGITVSPLCNGPGPVTPVYLIDCPTPVRVRVSFQ